MPRVCWSDRPNVGLYCLHPVRVGPVRVAGSQLPLALAQEPVGLPVLDTRDQRGASFLKVPARSVLNPPSTTHMGFWSINPYVGCEFGCSYCYARRTHEWRLERAGVPGVAATAHDSFEKQILVKDAAPEVLLRTLQPALVGHAELIIGTATDPYQPAERTFQLTRRILQALLLHKGLTLGIITKSPLVVRDVDVLTALAERHDVMVNISIASVDAELLRRLEARSPAPHARMRALGRLRQAGIKAGVMLAPILPGITDDWQGLAALFEQAREAGACYVAGGALHLGPAARHGFYPVLKREFPDLVERYERRYGKSDSPGKDYEKALARRLRTLQEAFGFPVASGMSRRARATEVSA